MAHKIHWFENGQASVLAEQEGGVPLSETMHSFIGPWQEAQQVYLEQAQVVERLATGEGPLVIFDIGFGIGANAFAVYEAFLGGARDVHLISFEKDLDGIRTALGEIQAFPFLARHEGVLRSILSLRRFDAVNSRGKTLRWDLIEGDFRGAIEGCPRAEVVFFDLYSPKICPELWGYRSFDLVYRCMSGAVGPVLGVGAGGPLSETAIGSKNGVALREAESSGLAPVLVTYCAATSVRSAMLMARFCVGYGVATTGKRETTVASLTPAALARPLDSAWYEKRSRSSKPFPSDIPN